MSDIERRLRDLGESVRSDQSPSTLPPHIGRKVRRRRLATLAAGFVVVAALGFGSTYAIGALNRPNPQLGPADGSQGNFSRLVSVFSQDEQVIVEVDADEGTICAVLGSLDGQELLTRVEIVADLDDPRTVVSLRPKDHAFVPKGGGAECVRNVEHDIASEIIARPGRYFLLVDGPNESLRISALSEAHGDGNFAIGPHMTIARGKFLGVEWEYYGYESNDGLCLELAWGKNSGGGCGGRGRRVGSAVMIDGVGMGREPDGSSATHVTGQVSDAVKRLELEVGDEPPEQVEIYQPPAELRLKDRVFVHLIDARRLKGDPEVWLVAYDAKNHELDRQRVNIWGVGKETKEEAARAFSAIWPEDTLAEAEGSCSAAEGGGDRDDPVAVAVAFTTGVLEWDPPGHLVVRRSMQGRRDVEIRRSPDDDGARADGPAIMVYMNEVLDGCWSVASVSPLPDEALTLSMSIRGRFVEIDFDDLGADTMAFEIGHGPHTLEGEPMGRGGRITSRLTYAPDDTGHFLILFKDEEGRVFSAFGRPLPAGNFTSG